jgi:DNA (cytosine-5)-methyltransferase 1
MLNWRGLANAPQTTTSFQGGWVTAMRFVDLFAGLGGFHVALSRLGHQCVFAAEIDPDLQSTYHANFGILPAGDIRSVATNDIPPHEILCAGFPCQSFSKAGNQAGLRCPQNGNLFGHIMRIIRSHRPGYLLLENVPHLLKHDDGNTWAFMKTCLTRAGYSLSFARLSPHEFGIPQRRDRLYLVGSRRSLDQFLWPTPSPVERLSLADALDKSPKGARPITAQMESCLAVWQDFLDRFPKDVPLPSFPIWSMEFGATYPYEVTTPFGVSSRALARFRGSHGQSLSDLSPAERFAALPSHARTAEAQFPEWKQHFIRSNRELYSTHRTRLKGWLPLITQFPSSLQKLEWNCKDGKRDVWKYIVQFRASGVRLKRNTTAPSLVAMTTTQVPIVAWQKRFLTPRECARLQSLGSLRHLPASETAAFKALGNAVNADVVYRIAAALLPVSRTRFSRRRRITA